MYTKAFLLLGVLAVFCCVTAVCCEVSVGVKTGDWIEYNVVTTGTPVVDHDITWARMEVLDVSGSEFRANVTTKNPAGTFSSLVRTFNLEEGDVQGWVIIPANLEVGESFFDSYLGYEVTVEGEEEVVVAGAVRVITFADTPERFKRWDKETGVFVETIDYLDAYTINSTAVATNMWSPEIFGIEQTSFILLVSGAVALVAVVVLAFFGRQK